ncbi:MAG: hypothetical protein BWY19_00316 [bacterium ADurb.Bin212]|nr:MAG: hypothetical protein BWY19_00316 [bacterium ADurb.Bin212]
MPKKLLLHSCCAPCLTSVYEKLSPLYDITVFWYNPNIWPQTEHDKRLKTLRDYCKKIGANLLIGEYDYYSEHKYWLNSIKGFENEPEKGKRCEICFRLRLEATAHTALALSKRHDNPVKIEYFATELSVSPHKNAKLLNQIGKSIEQEMSGYSDYDLIRAEQSLTASNFDNDSTHLNNHPNPKYLSSDFKKDNGFKRSVEICREHNIYRQNYCGCEFSLY